MGQFHMVAGPTEAPLSVTELVEQNIALVGRLVRERLTTVPPHVNRDDLTSAGMLALFVSAQAYDQDLGIPFACYAAIRIRGALVDELRGMDWATRSVRRQDRQVETVRGRLAVALKRAPKTEELADAMQVSPGKLKALSADLARANVIRLHDFSPIAANDLRSESSAGPESLILTRERLGYLHDAIAELSERRRFVINAYYFEQRHMVDIAAEMGLSQARVSQLCTEAVGLLRDGINSQLDPSDVDVDGQSRRTAATQQAYFGAIADRGTLASRLAMSTSRGEMLRRADVDRAKIA